MFSQLRLACTINTGVLLRHFTLDRTLAINKEQFFSIGRAIKLLAPFLKRYKWRLVAGFICLLGVDGLQLVIPRIIKRAVDDLQFGSASQPLLLQYAAVIAAMAAIIALCRFGWRYFIIGFSRLVEVDLRGMLLKNILRLDLPYFQQKSPGAIMAVSGNDLAAVQLAAGMGLVAFTDAIIMTLAAMGAMLYIHPKLTLIAMAPMPVLAIITGILSALLHKQFKKVQEQFSTITEHVRTSLASIRLLKAYNQEKSQTRRLNTMGREYVKDNIKQATVQGTLFPLSGFIASLSLLLVVYFGGRLTIDKVISIGDFVAFITYLQMLTWPMMAIGWVTNLFQRGATSLERLNEVLAAEPLLIDHDIDNKTPPCQGQISIKHLNFQYPGQSNTAIKDISLELSTGLTGLIGRTGSGKSTLCQLICRLYPIADDCVYLDGQDVNSIPLAAVRDNISYVPQGTTLFADTIAANIAFGRPEAKRSEIIAVAKAAAIHNEITNFELGYDTRIGEKGLTLSGGQRQRLALARALLLDRPILIIDDGLSAVDTQTEYQISQALLPYLKNRTCIMISHRLSPLLNADKIIIIEQGAIADQGRHEELLYRNKYYAIIHEHQMNGGR